MKRKAFTLLEVMIVLLLLSIAGSVISIRVGKAIDKKRFSSDIEKLKSRMYIIQKLAVSSQSDWTCVLKKEGEAWAFSSHCDDDAIRTFSPLKIAKMEIALNGKKVTDQIRFNFSASGHTSPDGQLTFSRDSYTEQWENALLFQRKEGHESGPTCPTD